MVLCSHSLSMNINASLISVCLQVLDILFCTLSFTMIVLHYAPLTLATQAAVVMLIAATMVSPIINNPTNPTNGLLPVTTAITILVSSWLWTSHRYHTTSHVPEGESDLMSEELDWDALFTQNLDHVATSRSTVISSTLEAKSLNRASWLTYSPLPTFDTPEGESLDTDSESPVSQSPRPRSRNRRDHHRDAGDVGEEDEEAKLIELTTAGSGSGDLGSFSSLGEKNSSNPDFGDANGNQKLSSSGAFFTRSAFSGFGGQSFVSQNGHNSKVGSPGSGRGGGGGSGLESISRGGSSSVRPRRVIGEGHAHTVDGAAGRQSCCSQHRWCQNTIVRLMCCTCSNCVNCYRWLCSADTLASVTEDCLQCLYSLPRTVMTLWRSIFGLILACAGITCFCMQTKDDYWILHSLWHFFTMSSAYWLLRDRHIVVGFICKMFRIPLSHLEPPSS